LAASGPVSVRAKPGGSYEQREADEERCNKLAQEARIGDLPPSNSPTPQIPYNYAYSPAANMAGSFVALIIIGGIQEAEMRDHAEELCLKNLGYRMVPLTPGEASEYARLSSSKKSEWERKFLGSDIAARYDAVFQPAVPPLPDIPDGPMRQGGLQFDGFAVAAKLIGNHDLLLTSKATRVRTAVLTTPIETKEGDIRIVADPGTVFHLVDYRHQVDPLLRPDGATWCGLVHQLSKGNSTEATYCFVGREDGYEVFRAGGESWFAGPAANAQPLPRYREPIKLEERAQDDLGPLDFDITVLAINKVHVLLSAGVTHDGKRVELWQRYLNWNQHKKAVLPLWDRRVTLTIDGRLMDAELESGGDGSDWRSALALN